MSHIQTLNLLNSKSVLSYTSGDFGDARTGDQQFTDLLKTMRAAEHESTRRVQDATRSSKHRSEQRRVESRQAEAGNDRQESTHRTDRDDETTRRTDRDDDQDRRRSGREESQASRGDVGPTEARTEPSESAALKGDRVASEASSGQAHDEGPQDGRTGQGSQGEATSGEARASDSAEAPSGQDQQEGATAKSGGAVAPPAETGPKQAEVQEVVPEATGSADMQEGAGPKAASSQASKEPEAPQGSSNETQQPAKPAGSNQEQTVQPIQQAAGQTELTTEKASTASTEASDSASKAAAQAVPASESTQTKASSQEAAPSATQQQAVMPSPATENRQPQQDASQDHAQRSSKGEVVPQGSQAPQAKDMVPGEIKAEAGERARANGQVDVSAKQSDQPPAKRITGGFITQMSTVPVKGEGAESAPARDSASEARHQSLAVEATRQLARFMIQADGKGESTRSASPTPSASSGSTSGVQATGAATTTTGQATIEAPATPGPSTPSEATRGTPTSGVSQQVETSSGTRTDNAVDRIARVMRAHMGSRDSQVRLQLDPPDLGRVRIDIRMRHSTLVLNIQTETAAGREALAGRLNELREALQQQGIHVERANVQMREAVPEAPHAREHQQQTPQQQQHTPNQDASGQASAQSGDPDGRDGAGRGEDKSVSARSDEDDASSEESDEEIVLADDEGRVGASPTAATESAVDLVA